MNKAHQYDLSFVTYANPQTQPELVFSIDEAHLPETKERLVIITKRRDEHFVRYLGRHYKPFIPFQRELFETTFGYGSCGYMTNTDGQVQLRVRLGSGVATWYATATISLLNIALCAPFKIVISSNRQQLFMLETETQHGASGCGHAVGGFLFRPIMEWLREYARSNTESEYPDSSAKLPPQVTRAMDAAWYSVTRYNPTFADMESMTNGWIQRSGSFRLIIWGNATDLSVYPDNVRNDRQKLTEFGCNNLDTAEQQLVLLAGFATLCQLARESS